MSTRSILTVFLPICLVGLTASVTAASDAAPPPAGSPPLRAAAVPQMKSWHFYGTVRYICDLSGKEESMSFSGVTPDLSHAQALAFAKESGAAAGAVWGRVVSVNVRSLI